MANRKTKISILIIMIMLMITVSSCTNTDKQDKEQGEKTEDKYNELYYYNEKNFQRYQEYQNKNPNLDFEEVIWRVEADIDKLSYEDMTNIDYENENSEQLLVNKHFKLRDDYEPKNLTQLKGRYYATENTVIAFKEMEKAAQKENIVLDICSAYRSLERQSGLYNKYIIQDGKEKADTYSARPGTSEHHTGRAIDMISENGLEGFINTDAYTWLQENAYKYGFIFRYPQDSTDITGYMPEPWHITYVGKEVSNTMRDENIKTFEEYWVKYVKYKE